MNLMIATTMVAISLQANAMRLQDIPSFIDSPKKFLLENPEELQKGLVRVLDSRCRTYARINKQCTNSAKKLIQEMQVEGIEITHPKTKTSYKYVVTFAQDLDLMMKHPNTLAFLQELDVALDTKANEDSILKFISNSSSKKIDIGLMSMKHFGNYPTALKALGSLFQDTSESEIQTHYLLKKFGPSLIAKTLHKTISKMNDYNSSMQAVAVNFFGRSFFNARIYHFLVPALLASKLQMAGYSPEISVLQPFLFNYLYEASAEASQLRLVFMEPESISQKATQNDIRSGEVGAFLGAGHSTKVLSDDRARTLLSSSPSKYIETLVAQLPLE